MLLRGKTFTIVFAKGCPFALMNMASSGASALGIDWNCPPEYARSQTEGKITLQGNYDPARLFSPSSQIKKEVKILIDTFGKNKYIVNLGHGILPNTPVGGAKAFVDAVKNYK